MMGGPGSGSWHRRDAKVTTERTHWIDIRYLKKHECLQPGAGSLSWSRGDEKAGFIGYRMETDQMILNYKHQINDRVCEEIEQTIKFDRTSCNYGGYRTWFLCPRCWTRVAILYGAGKYFLCRHCYNLTFSSQQETPPFRLLRKARKIRERLGANGDIDAPIIIKPLGMHYGTFNRLRNEVNNVSDQSWLEMAKRISK
jgi:hypothetical protein